MDMLRRKCIIWGLCIITGECIKSPGHLANVFNHLLIPYIPWRMCKIPITNGECDKYIISSLSFTQILRWKYEICLKWLFSCLVFYIPQLLSGNIESRSNGPSASLTKLVRPGNAIGNISISRVCLYGPSGWLVEITENFLRISLTTSYQPKL